MRRAGLMQVAEGIGREFEEKGYDYWLSHRLREPLNFCRKVDGEELQVEVQEFECNSEFIQLCVSVDDGTKPSRSMFSFPSSDIMMWREGDGEALSARLREIMLKGCSAEMSVRLKAAQCIARELEEKEYDYWHSHRLQEPWVFRREVDGEVLEVEVSELHFNSEFVLLGIVVADTREPSVLTPARWVILIRREKEEGSVYSKCWQGRE
jgi:hypothetical protein